MMKTNTGTTDRVIRLIVGILLIVGKLAGVSFLAGTLGTVLAVVGAVFIVVAAVSQPVGRGRRGPAGWGPAARPSPRPCR